LSDVSAAVPPVYRPRSWHLLFVALIAVFNAIVLYMVLTPRVADDYHAYYIDRSSSCFPRVTSGYYVLGEPISFVPGRSGFKLDSVRWCGFMPPSTTGIRSFGDYGIIRMKLPLPDDDLLLTFSSWANTDASKPPRDVDVVINGENVETLVFNSAKRVNGRIVIPQRVAKAGGKDDKGNDILEIKFVVPRTGPPGTNSEPVTLQLRLEAMRVTALGNVSEPVAVAMPPTSPSSARWAPSPTWGEGTTH
ncbi:MAG: hypothetical protein ABI398_13390, partial [Devosia sp.]